jgi:antitoxin component YwqK of YwqJK toxin-antitoxin module
MNSLFFDTITMETLPYEIAAIILGYQPILYGKMRQLNSYFNGKLKPLCEQFVELNLIKHHDQYHQWTELPNGAKHGVQTSADWALSGSGYIVIHWQWGVKHGVELMYSDRRGCLIWESTWDKGVKSQPDIGYGWSIDKKLTQISVYSVNPPISSTTYHYRDSGFLHRIAPRDWEGNYHGLCVEYNDNGVKTRECNYLSGKRHGNWIRYDEITGEPVEKRIYSEEKLIDKWYVIQD